MKKLIILVSTLAVIAILYFVAISVGFNLPKPKFLEDKGIEGNAELRITLLMDNNVRNPLPNIEVDVAEKPGQPPKGGVGTTDEEGVATFKIKPGVYFIYFNDLTFPKNLATPQPEQIEVLEGIINEKTLLVTTRSNN